MKKKKLGKVKAYSYTRIAGNYLKIFSAPARLLILIIIIIFLLMLGFIFVQAVFFS